MIWLCIETLVRFPLIRIPQRAIHRSLFFLLWLYTPFLGLSRLFGFLTLYTVSRTPWTRDQPVARTLPTHKTEQTQNKRTQTSMPRVFELAKIVHALDSSTIVIDFFVILVTVIRANLETLNEARTKFSFSWFCMFIHSQSYILVTLFSWLGVWVTCSVD
jgi:hypothetical protein